MDYLLSDSYSTQEAEEGCYREKIIRMPDSWLCYDPPASADRRQADDLMRRARQAMREHNYQAADSLVQRAEDLNVKYDSLFRPFVDTPQKLRKDLEKARAAADSSARLPSQQILGTASSRNGGSAPQDPYRAGSDVQLIETLTGNHQARAP